MGSRLVNMVTRKSEGQSRDKFPEGLNIVHDVPDAVADIIFVHGITGHPFKSWSADKDKQPWIKTLLPNAIPRARILTFGYHAEVVGDPGSVSQNSLRLHSSDLLNMISWDEDRKKDRAVNNERPIIFVCHSLGGLLVQQALSQASHTEKHQHILKCILGIAFMGTPLRGSEKTLILALRGALGIVRETNKKITEILKRNSEELRILQTGFRGMLGIDRDKGGLKGLNVICFIEQRALAPWGIIVSEESATLDGYTSQTIYGDHRTMAQFSSASDAGFKGLTSEMTDWLEKLTPNLNRPQPVWESRTASGSASGIMATSMSSNNSTGGPSAEESYQAAEKLKISFRAANKAYSSKSTSPYPPAPPRTSQLQDAIFHYSEAIRLSGINSSTQSFQPYANSSRPWREGEETASHTYTTSCVGIAECRREMSHRIKFKYAQKVQYLNDGIKYLHKAYEEASSALARSATFPAGTSSGTNSFTQLISAPSGNGNSLKTITWPDRSDAQSVISDVSSIHTSRTNTTSPSPSPSTLTLDSYPTPGHNTPTSPQQTKWSTLLLRIKLERAMILARRTVIHETEGSGQTQFLKQTVKHAFKQTLKQSLTPVVEAPGTRPEMVAQGSGGSTSKMQMVARRLAGGAMVTLEQVHEGRSQALRELEMVIEEARAVGRDDFVEYARKGVGSLVC